VAELGRFGTLTTRSTAQSGQLEQKARPNSMPVMIVDPPELPPAHDVAVGGKMVGFKSTATSVTAEDYLEGTEYVRIYGFKNGACSSFGHPIISRWSQASVTG
jgi:hypothetical protein